jgi:protein TonB
VHRLRFEYSSPSFLTSAAISLAFHGALVGLTLKHDQIQSHVIDEGTVLPALYLPPTSHQMKREVTPSEWGALGNLKEEMDRAGGPQQQVAIPIPGIEEQQASGLPEPQGGLPAGLAISEGDSIFTEVWVDSIVSRDDASAAPVYPPQLLRNNIEGIVFAQFVVDTIGMVDVESVRILTSTHPLFTNSVQIALGGMRFRPAMRAGRHVHQLVEEHFAFKVALPPEQASNVGYDPKSAKP